MTALELIFPATCVGCGKPADSESPDLCHPCGASLVRIDDDRCPSCALPGRDNQPCVGCQLRPPPYTRTFAAFEFGGVLADTVRRAKFGPDLTSWHAVVRWAREPVRDELIDCRARGFAVTWVPMASRSARRRGFDAPAIALHWMGVSAVGLLRQSRRATNQARVSAASRLDAARAAFDVVGEVPERVCIFDDIITTGSTMRAVAEKLRAAGAREIECVAIARTPALHD